MKCQVCGKENTLDSNFCTGCGNKILKITSNPTKVHEIVLKILNMIIIPALFFSSAILLLMIIIWPLALMENYDANIDLLGNDIFLVNGIIVLISSNALLILNIIMGIVMYKKNKKNRSVSKNKAIGKSTYVLLTFFLGNFGVHRFVIGDILGGIIRIVLEFGLTIFITILVVLFNFIGLSWIFLIFLPHTINNSLRISDFVIGLSKVSNDNKKIYIY